MDPMLASVDGPVGRPAPVDVNVEEVPMLAEAPDAGAVERATPTYTPAELLAATVRGRVLEEDPDTRPLDGKDAGDGRQGLGPFPAGRPAFRWASGGLAPVLAGSGTTWPSPPARADGPSA